MRVLAAILGAILVLPGLCFLGFGAIFTFNRYTLVYGLTELVVGGLIIWGVVALFSYSGKKK